MISMLSGSSQFFKVLNVSGTSSSAGSGASSTVRDPRTATATHQCFAAAFAENQRRWAESNSSREILDTVRVQLLAQATAEAVGVVEKDPRQQLLEAPSNATEAHAAIREIFATALASASASASVQSTWGDVAAKHDELDQDPPSSDGSVSESQDLQSESGQFSLADAVGGSTRRASDALLHVKTAVAKLLQSLVPSSDKDTIRKFRNASEWRALESSVDGLEKLTVGLQRELERALSAAQVRFNRSVASTLELLAHAEAQVASSFDSQDREWKAAVHSVLDAYERSWSAASERIRSLASALKMTTANFVVRRHIRELVRDDASRVDDLATRELYLIQRRRELQLGAAHVKSDLGGDVLPVIAESTSARVRRVLAAGAGLWRSAERFAYFVDWSCVCLRILDVMFALWTDSFTALSPVDIRGISSLQTLVRHLRLCVGYIDEDVPSSLAATTAGGALVSVC